MSSRTDRTARVTHFLHKHLLTWVVISYALASTCPKPGLWIKDAVLLNLALPAGRMTLNLPTLLLSFLLFTAGMRVRIQRIGEIARRPGVLFAGLATNLVLPIAFLALLLPTLRAWHNPDEAAMVLFGLALVTAMPIAGSSAGWAQAADGDMALSLGLVLSSTLLSPLTTPAALHTLGLIAPGRYGSELHRLAGQGTGAFLAVWVLSPSALGILTRTFLGEERATHVERPLRLVAPLALPVLCYANASACLPEALGHPDWDFLGVTLAFVSGLCVLTFAAGYWLGRLLNADRPQRAALMFGLGMNNNGTGLVLASLALGAQPMVMLPIIMYNLTQHLAAGCVDALLRRRGPIVPLPELTAG